MATKTIAGSTGSKTFTCTLTFITSGGQWAYQSGKISDAGYWYVNLPSYGTITSCKITCNASITASNRVANASKNGAGIYMANSSTTTGSALTNTSNSAAMPTDGTVFTLSSAALSTINSSKPTQLGIRIAVTSSGSNYTPSTTINQTSGQTTTASGSATLTVSSFSITIEYYNPTVNYYTGSEWKACVPYYYDGSKWVECEAKYYNGSTWKELTGK